MFIRMGSIEELEKLWGEGNSSTKKYFINGIKEGRQEFWVIEKDKTKELIGELHIFWDSIDKDEADGKNRAYLCAFRILEEYRREGFGSLLMERVLQRIKDRGFIEATVGVYEDEEALIGMYNKMGFTTSIKSKDIDHHNIDEKGNPRKDKPIVLLLSKLQD